MRKRQFREFVFDSGVDPGSPASVISADSISSKGENEEGEEESLE